MNRFLFVVFCIFLIVMFSLAIYDFGTMKFRADLNGNLWSSFFAAILFTVLLFVVNEFFFKVNVNGEWKVLEIIEGPDYNPYVNYKLDYIFHIIQIGSQIHGFGEKVSQLEGASGVFTIFERVKRVRVEISGHIEKSYFGKTTVTMLIYEKGRERETSSYLYLVYKKGYLAGRFTSTAGNAKGPIEMILVNNLISS